MAAVPSIQICKHPFTCLSSTKPRPSFALRAQEPDKDRTESQTPPEPDEFEERLSKMRFKYRSGTGKKADLRRARKSGPASSKKKGGGGVFLPPVPLKEPVSGGLKVDFGFSPYTERLNGRLACLGLTALLLVELGSGKSVIDYHSPAIVLIQIYFVAAVGALYVKYEKEKVSVWPEPSKK